MKGLRIHGDLREASVFPYEGSSFAYFFAPILPRISTLHWLYQSCPFECPFDRADISDALDKLPANNGYIAPNTLLPRFARYVSDDWSSLFGFDTLPDAPAIFAHLDPRDYEFMERHITHCFFSIDGAYWDFYSHDPVLLSLIRTHIATLPCAYSEEVEFINFTL